MRASIITLSILLASAVLAGCGGAPTGPGAGPVPGAPARARITAAERAGGDTVVLRGERMTALASAVVSIGAARARVVGATDGEARVIVAPVDDAGCTSGGAAEAVAAEGADVAAGVSVRRRRAGELALAVGVPARLSAGDVRCLRLAPIAGAEYALAFLDARLVNRAATGFEGAAPSPNSYVASIAEAGQAAPGAGGAASASRAALDGDVRRTAGALSSGSPAARSVPWQAGERFTLTDPSLAAPLGARVVRVYGGHLVFAIAEGQEPEGGAAAWIARADSAFETLVRDGYPLLRATLSATAPVSSAGSRQLLVVARRESSPYLGLTSTTSAGAGRLSHVFLNSAYAFSAAGLLRTAAHEVAHAWQEQYAAEAGMAPGASAAWALEGGADLLAWAVLGRARGIGLLDNHDWAADAAAPDRAPFAMLAMGTRGDVTAGYASAASFLLDQAQRLARRGVAEDDAIAAAVRGAMEGWHGFDRTGARRMGLAGRMGDGWDAADALLRWTLSQAADDLTDAPDLQNHAFARVSTAGRATGAGWLAPAVLRSGGTATREDAGAPSTVSGNAATLTWRYGSPNYVRIEDDGFGGAYTLTATTGGAPLDEAAWMIVRIR
ncbi:MAG TPA: hypothetical protein VFQ45_19825 [Longimicrobium sp.]|nr:hypothetical protein [Longimicrobium sp.]